MKLAHERINTGIVTPATIEVWAGMSNYQYRYGFSSATIEIKAWKTNYVLATPQIDG